MCQDTAWVYRVYHDGIPQAELVTVLASTKAIELLWHTHMGPTCLQVLTKIAGHLQVWKWGTPQSTWWNMVKHNFPTFSLLPFGGYNEAVRRQGLQASCQSKWPCSSLAVTVSWVIPGTWTKRSMPLALNHFSNDFVFFWGGWCFLFFFQVYSSHFWLEIMGFSKRFQLFFSYNQVGEFDFPLDTLENGVHMWLRSWVSPVFCFVSRAASRCSPMFTGCHFSSMGTMRRIVSLLENRLGCCDPFSDLWWIWCSETLWAIQFPSSWWISTIPLTASFTV